MEPVVAAPLTDLLYDARLATLLSAGVGLWDVIQSANRSGSLDANIRDHQPNALAELVATLPGLRAVAFNGGKASSVGRRLLSAAREPGAEVPLPSSSPAYTVPFANKQVAWNRLGRVLRDSPSSE